MARYCLKNPRHKLFGPDRCLEPGCKGGLGDTGVEEEAERDMLRGEEDYTLNRDRDAADRALTVAETARSDVEAALLKAGRAEAKLSDDVERLRQEAAKADVAAEADRTRVTEDVKPETLIDHVEHAVESLVGGEVAKVRAAIGGLVERAQGKEVEARQAAADAVQHARTAADAAAKAAAEAQPHGAKPGFGEAAKHAAAAGYHANVAQTAAQDAASQADAASRSRQTVESLAAGATGATSAGGLHGIVAEIEKAVAAVEAFAAKAAVALERAKSASGEATAMGGFFAEALSLWRTLRA